MSILYQTELYVVKLGSPYLTCLKFYSLKILMILRAMILVHWLCFCAVSVNSLEIQIITCITCTQVYVKLLLDEQ